MWSRSLLALLVLALTGCPGGSAGIGESCDDHSDCSTGLQCIEGACEPKCHRAPECGDGYACDDDGICRQATGQAGDTCESEVDCAPGLSCQIDGTATDNDGYLLASCTAQNAARPPGDPCDTDAQCRDGTCALGRCVDLCRETRDCSADLACMDIPRVESNGIMFEGCLPQRGNVTWKIPVPTPSASTILIPIPNAARGATVLFTVDDVAQRVGARSITSPSGLPLYMKPCDVGTPGCDATGAADQYFSQPLRHLPDFGQSVLQIPSNPDIPLEPGLYRVAVSSFRQNGTAGSATPHVTVVLKMDDAAALDLHFHFLNLADHPCRSLEPGRSFPDTLNAQFASIPGGTFETAFLDPLQQVFYDVGLDPAKVTYDDILDKGALDGLSSADVGSLLALGSHGDGVDVFFVRTLSPVGLQAIGPNPGPSSIPGTSQSGVVIGVDTLCYRQWGQLARLTAHEIARFMGLYHNVELEVDQHPGWRDPIDDSDDSVGNLMYFTDMGGTYLSPGQRDILLRSTVLR